MPCPVSAPLRCSRVVLTLGSSARLRDYSATGGLAIVPLYVDDTYFIATSPYTVVDPDSFDEDATVVWRDDEYDAPFSRHYSPEALADRLGDTLALFSQVRVVHMTNLESVRERWPGSRLYADFMLESRK